MKRPDTSRTANEGAPCPPSPPPLSCPVRKWEDAPLAQEIFVIHNLMMRIGDKLVAPLGLTSSRWLMLSAIEQHETPPTVSQLSMHALLSVQNVSRMAAAMEQDGLIERFTCCGMGRATFVRMTDHGREVIDAARRAGRCFGEHFLAGFERGRIKDLESDLHTMIANLERLEADLASKSIEPNEVCATKCNQLINEENES